MLEQPTETRSNDELRRWHHAKRFPVVHNVYSRVDRVKQLEKFSVVVETNGDKIEHCEVFNEPGDGDEKLPAVDRFEDDGFDIEVWVELWRKKRKLLKIINK